ncbi:MAG: hypothetical protein A2177_06915 [Spirochaetes bacterium RBG_13_68_11]|nr:MAG: hypothetical protein A2177_06915 [Spirochaetes bacterium RBG_13_68_11]
MGRRFYLTASLAFLCLFVSCPFIPAQENDRPASVIVVVVPGENADAGFQSVLRDSLLVNLTRNRMRPAAVEQAKNARAMARQQRADYFVSGTYRNTTEDLELTLEVWLPDGRAPLATGKASGRISLTMDALVGAALDQVLPSMQSRFPADGTETAEGAVAAAGTAAVRTPEPPARWRRVELSVGGAPLVTTGSVADYAKIGALSTLSLDLRFPVGRGALAAGLLAGAGWLRATGIEKADILLVPVCADLRWTIDSRANPGVALHAGAGPAILVAVTSWAGTLTKIVPYVVGGLDVDIGLTPVLGLRLEADYTVVFEGSMVLQGFAPQLSLRTRF